MRIGFITDLHYRDAVPGTSRIARRECRLMPDVLDRTLDALVGAGVDLIVCAGDCVDTADDPAVLDDLAALRDRFAATNRPTIVIPGNHDPAPADFYRRLPQPPRRQRLADCEFISFYDDVCDPGSEQSTRSNERLQWMREALGDDPEDVALTFLIQHFVVYPEHQGPGYRHTYANDADIRAVLEASPRRLVVLSGHLHGGAPLTTYRGVTYFTGRALCERPFPYYLIDVGAQGDAGATVAAVAADRPERQRRGALDRSASRRSAGARLGGHRRGRCPGCYIGSGYLKPRWIPAVS